MNEKNKLNAAKLVSAAVIGADFKVVLVGGKRYVIYPPTIKKLAGAAYHLQEFDELAKIEDLLKSPTMLAAAAHALSWLIDGTDGLADELSSGTPKELADAIGTAYILTDTSPFSLLLDLSKSVGSLTANTKQ